MDDEPLVAAADVPAEFADLVTPHKNVVTNKFDDLESYVRWKRRGGALRVTVPFPSDRHGKGKKREKSIRVRDDMTPEDAIAHARHIQAIWTRRSLELRRTYGVSSQRSRLPPPDKHGLLGQITFRAVSDCLCVMYVNESGHFAHRSFPLPETQQSDVDAIRAVKEEAIEFVRSMLERGVETPIRRKFAGITAAHKTYPLTRYFSTLQRPE